MLTFKPAIGHEESHSSQPSGVFQRECAASEIWQDGEIRETPISMTKTLMLVASTETTSTRMKPKQAPYKPTPCNQKAMRTTQVSSLRASPLLHHLKANAQNMLMTLASLITSKKLSNTTLSSKVTTTHALTDIILSQHLHWRRSSKCPSQSLLRSQRERRPPSLRKEEMPVTNAKKSPLQREWKPDLSFLGKNHQHQTDKFLSPPWLNTREALYQFLWLQRHLLTILSTEQLN